MKLSRREIEALAKEFKTQLETRNQTVAFPKWRSSLEGQKIQKALKAIQEKQAEINKISDQINVIKSQIRKDIKTDKYFFVPSTIEEIYKIKNQFAYASLRNIEDALIVACIDSTSVHDLI